MEPLPPSLDPVRLSGSAVIREGTCVAFGLFCGERTLETFAVAEAAGVAVGVAVGVAGAAIGVTATSPTPQPVDGVRLRAIGVETAAMPGREFPVPDTSVRARTLRVESSEAVLSVVWINDAGLPCPMYCCDKDSSVWDCAALPTPGATTFGVTGAATLEGTSSSSESSKAPGRGMRSARTGRSLKAAVHDRV